MQKDYYVLYGSQTGNAEHISREIHNKLIELGINSKLSTCNGVKKVDLKELAHAVIIGNGDSPENCDAFWRWIKARSLAKNLFDGLPYAVLGLGDTNYDKFCFMGKSIDKRMGELGGRRIVDLHCADEPTNLEEVVESWKTKIIAAITTLDASEGASSELSDTCTCESKEEQLTLQSIKLTEVVSIIPDGVLSARDVWAALGLEGDIASPPAAKLLPGSGATGSADHVEVIASTGVASRDNAEMNGEAEAGPVEWSSEKPFMSDVISARYLTQPDLSSDKESWGEEKKVIEAVLSLSESRISYEPGDSVAICCPNPAPIVTAVLERLNASFPAFPFTRQTLVQKKNCKMCTLEELLSYKIDLVGLPKKAAVMRLSQCCKDPTEASLLQHICSKGDVGKKMWRTFIELQSIGIGELLALFPSCVPSLDQLVSACGSMPPRCYSIASSPLRDPNAVRIAFSVVKYTSSAGVGSSEGKTCGLIRRQGVCTTYLDTVLEPLLRPGALNNAESCPVKIRLFHKPSVNFKLPGSTSYPLILIGPGTGVAPFIGFLEQRAAIEKERLCMKSQPKCDADVDASKSAIKQRTISGSNCNIKFGAKECCMGEWRGGIEIDDLPIEGSSVDQYLSSVPPGPIWLFFGCRNTKDFLFQDEIQEFVHDTRTLDHLEIAFSRMGTEKTYVQHKMLQKGAELASLILEQSAYIYICGDGNKMAKDVEAAIVELLVRHGSASGVADDRDAKAVLADMRLRRRFVLDIWS